MGILTTDGAPMVWGSEAQQKAVQYVRDHGIIQLILLYKKFREVDNSPFLWGDEIEHIIVKTDPSKHRVKLSLRAADVIAHLSAIPDSPLAWRPEYGSFMVESVPAAPYTSAVASLLSVEQNMRLRCQAIDNALGEDEHGVTLVSFPLLGVGDFAEDGGKKESPYSESLFIPDVCINQSHPRFAALTRNIRLRRGRKVCIQVPLFLDKFTTQKTVDKTYNIDYTPMNSGINCAIVDPEKAGTKRRRVPFGAADDEDDDEKDAGTKKNGMSHDTTDTTAAATMSEVMQHLSTPITDYYYAQYEKDEQHSIKNVKARYEACPCPVPSVSHPCIYMDCMAFGMGLSCLQVTMQLKNITEARKVYDLLIPLCPLLLAVTSATPVQKGLLCDSDVRWVTISASVDDRRADEVPRIIKSRYDSVSMYLSTETPAEVFQSLNDHHVEIDAHYYEQLRAAGMDDRLARHFAHLFIRDPLVIYERGIEQLDDRLRSDHFENIQTTNWQSLRFKPPPVDGSIGWRVEFRVMEVMPTPFENAAFSVFVILFVQASLKFGSVWYQPMSEVDENVGRAHKRNPCEQTYYWRKNFNDSAAMPQTERMPLAEIFNGSPANGKTPATEGIVPFVRRYLESEGIHDPRIDKYLQLVSQRAAGTLATTAQMLRNFVMSHPDYKRDSRVTQEIGADIVGLAHHLAAHPALKGYLPADLVGEKEIPYVVASKRD